MLMGAANPTKKVQSGVSNILVFLKPKTNKEKCQIWIKQSGRLHEHLNLPTISKNTFVCSCCHCYFYMFTFCSLSVALKLIALLDNKAFLESLICRSKV